MPFSSKVSSSVLSQLWSILLAICSSSERFWRATSAVSRVLASLVAPGHVAYTLKERSAYRLGLLSCGGSPTHGFQPLAQAPLVLLGLAPMVLEHFFDLGVVCC